MNAYPALTEAAKVAEWELGSRLEDSHIPLHAISARAKDPRSVRQKLLLKNYANPAASLTDQLGIRIVTYFEDDIDRVVEWLGPAITVNASHSVDRRRVLGTRKFGYRSVHLVGRLRGFPFGARRDRELDRRWFEVQIRSILEHGWAEIEHTVVYKAGIDYSDQVLRAWNALAGALEVADGQFLTLRSQRRLMVAERKEALGSGGEWTDSWDAARLMAFMEIERPDGLGWIQAESTGKPFPPESEVAAMRALSQANLSTPDSLRAAMARVEFKRATERYAKTNFVLPNQVSHLACVVLAIRIADATALHEYFADLATDRDVTAAVSA